MNILAPGMPLIAVVMPTRLGDLTPNRRRL